MATAEAQSLKEFDDLRTHLEKCKTEKDANVDLYNHVCQVMSHIVMHCPDQALNKLEEVSYLLKHKNTKNLEEFLKVNAIKDYAKPSDESTKESTTESIKTAQEFFKVSYQYFLNFLGE